MRFYAFLRAFLDTRRVHYERSHVVMCNLNPRVFYCGKKRKSKKKKKKIKETMKRRAKGARDFLLSW